MASPDITADITTNAVNAPGSGSKKGTFQGRGYRLERRVNPNGEVSPFWYVAFRVGKRRVFQSTGTAQITAAHGVAKKKLKVAMEGRWEALEAGKIKQDSPTLGTLILCFEKWMPARTNVKRSTICGYASSMRAVMKVMKPGVKMEEVRATELTRELMRGYKDAMYPVKGTPGEIEKAQTTINSRLAQCRGLFSKQALELYHDKGYKLPDLTGFLGVPKFKSERDVSFVPIEAGILAKIDAAAWALLKADPGRAVTLPDGRVDDRLVRERPDVLLAYVMARWLGMRDIEIAAARWEWIEQWQDGHRMAIVKRAYFHPKHTEGRVPMAKELHATLEKYGDKSSVWILPARTMTDRSDAVYRDCNFFLRQWLPDRVKAMHELRKQAGSQVYTQTKSLSMAAEFLRNKEETCRKHYATMLVPPPALVMTMHDGCQSAR